MPLLHGLLINRSAEERGTSSAISDRGLSQLVLVYTFLALPLSLLLTLAQASCLMLVRIKIWKDMSVVFGGHYHLISNAADDLNTDDFTAGVCFGLDF